jgi:hypothetical protein
MTIGPMSQCETCRHFRSAWLRVDGDAHGRPFCAAFPEADGGIPQRVFDNREDHRGPIYGDHGVRWESTGEQYPGQSLPRRPTHRDR